nr:hypothetical protein [Amylibacter sp.]
MPHNTYPPTIEKITPISRGQDLTEEDLRMIVQDLYDIRNWASLQVQLSVVEQKEQMFRTLEVRLGRRPQIQSN